mgnify:CR=1 FL=1
MTRLVFALLLFASPAGAGSYTVTADDAALADIAAKANVTPQQVLQRAADSLIRAKQQADRAVPDIRRTLAMLQQACRTGDAKACERLKVIANAVNEVK